MMLRRLKADVPLARHLSLREIAYLAWQRHGMKAPRTSDQVHRRVRPRLSSSSGRVDEKQQHRAEQLHLFSKCVRTVLTTNSLRSCKWSSVFLLSADPSLSLFSLHPKGARELAGEVPVGRSCLRQRLAERLKHVVRRPRREEQRRRNCFPDSLSPKSPVFPDYPQLLL